MEIYAEWTTRSGSETLQLVAHPDGRVGTWSPADGTWREVYGLGTNQAGFINEILNRNSYELTDAGRCWISRRSRAVYNLS